MQYPINPYNSLTLIIVYFRCKTTLQGCLPGYIFAISITIKPFKNAIMKTINKDFLIRTLITVGMILAIAGGYYAYIVNK